MSEVDSVDHNSGDTFLDEYQEFVDDMTENHCLDNDGKITWATMGLNSEAGEVAGCIEHMLRKGLSLDDHFSKKGVTYREHIMDELGDVFWTATACCNAIDVTPQEVMEFNMEKLTKRVYGETST